MIWMNDWTKWWWRQSNINSKYQPQQQQQLDTYETNNQDNWWRRSWCGYITGSNVGKQIQEKGRGNYEGSNNKTTMIPEGIWIESNYYSLLVVGLELRQQHIIVRQKPPCHATNHCYHYLCLLLLLPLQKNHHLLSAYLNKIAVFSKNIK